MDFFQVATVIVVLTALFTYINHKSLKLPTTIGVMLMALVFSFILNIVPYFGLGIEPLAEKTLQKVDFNQVLLHGMLAFLLFAGALFVDLDDLRQQKWTVGLLASVGVLASTGIIAGFAWWLFPVLGFQMPFLYCLLLGALLSPTDPVAALGLIRKVGVPKHQEVRIVGESLFNDGFAVVFFSILLAAVKGEHDLTPFFVGKMFLQEAVGGLLLGLLAGLGVYFLLRRVDDYNVEVLMTLALVMGGFSLADFLHMSGPLAMVAAGLLIGNHGRSLAMTDKVRENLDTFWEMVDEILNAVLFVLIGLEVLLLSIKANHILSGMVMIPVALAARFVAVGGMIRILSFRRFFPLGTSRILTWGGLRGGISVAMALSLPQGHEREVIVMITYVVVVFSILVQGMTLTRVVSHFQKKANEA